MTNGRGRFEPHGHRGKGTDRRRSTHQRSSWMPSSNCTSTCCVIALGGIVGHEIPTEMMPATALLALVMDQSTPDDEKNMYLDLIASANRKPSVDSTALNALIFHQGLHALVCYRVAHRLWRTARTGLAYCMHSTVSSRYAADIHPAAEMEGGMYLSVGDGVW